MNMILSRHRIMWSRISRIKSYPFARPISITKSINTLAVTNKNMVLPCTVGFSLFTWLGFEKPTSAEDELINTIKHCVLFIKKTEYVKAEQLLHVALRQAQQLQHQNGITYIYDVMANLALEREQLDKAKTLFINVTQRIMADGAKEDDLRVVHLSAKLARVSHLKKEYTTAQMGYDWCLKKLRSLSELDEQTKKLLAMTEDWYGRLFLECNQNEQGLELMLQSLNHMREVSDVEIDHIVIQLNDIGTVCDLLNRTDDSISYFKEAIELSRRVPEMNDLGAMYVNLGKAYIKKNMLENARKNCGYGWKLGVSSENNDIKTEAEQCLKQIRSVMA